MPAIYISPLHEVQLMALLHRSCHASYQAKPGKTLKALLCISNRSSFAQSSACAGTTTCFSCAELSACAGTLKNPQTGSRPGRVHPHQQTAARPRQPCRASAASDGDPPKRKRGRPRKIDSEPVPQSPSASDADGILDAAPKRGRPRAWERNGSAGSAALSAESALAVAPAEPASDVAPNVQSHALIAPKVSTAFKHGHSSIAFKRGRGNHNPHTHASSPASAAEPSELASAAAQAWQCRLEADTGAAPSASAAQAGASAASDGEPPAQKRGQTRKAENEPVAFCPPASGADSIPNTVPKRGRPRGSQSNSSAASVALSAEPVLDAAQDVRSHASSTHDMTSGLNHGRSSGAFKRGRSSAFKRGCISAFKRGSSSLYPRLSPHASSSATAAQPPEAASDAAQDLQSGLGAETDAAPSASATLASAAAASDGDSLMRKRGRPRKADNEPAPQHPPASDADSIPNTVLKRDRSSSNPHTPCRASSPATAAQPSELASAAAQGLQSRLEPGGDADQTASAGPAAQDQADEPGPDVIKTSASSGQSSRVDSSSSSAAALAEEPAAAATADDDDPWASLNGHLEPPSSLDSQEVDNLVDSDGSLEEAGTATFAARAGIRLMDLSDLVPARRIRGVLQTAERSWAATQAHARSTFPETEAAMEQAFPVTGQLQS